jgi:hypothetical protein
VSGELAASGVCAAVALTYEATLPRLDEALARAQVCSHTTMLTNTVHHSMQRLPLVILLKCAHYEQLQLLSIAAMALRSAV